jgi:hypothetical protein
LPRSKVSLSNYNTCSPSKLVAAGDSDCYQQVTCQSFCLSHSVHSNYNHVTDSKAHFINVLHS